MIENSKPRLEEDDNEETNEPEKFQFPIGAAITCGVIVLLMIACIIVISILK